MDPRIKQDHQRFTGFLTPFAMVIFSSHSIKNFIKFHTRYDEKLKIK